MIKSECCTTFNSQLEKILGESNIVKNISSPNDKNINKNYSIKANVMKIYSSKIDEELVGVIIEYNINIVEIHNKLSHNIDNLPSNVNVLILHNCSESQLYDLPSSITHLYFVNLLGELNCLSSGVKVIDFGNKFDSNIKNLPYTVEEIILGNEFNQSVDYLPLNLKIIKFGEKFNRDISNLPLTLERIIFGKNFNQDISNLPNSIKYIQFDWVCDFSHQIFRLPNNLEEIYFNNSFSNDICEIPAGVKKILLGANFSKPINLPDGLEKIKVCSKYKYLNLINYMSRNKHIIKELYF